VTSKEKGAQATHLDLNLKFRLVLQTPPGKEKEDEKKWMEIQQ